MDKSYMDGKIFLWYTRIMCWEVIYISLKSVKCNFQTPCSDSQIEPTNEWSEHETVTSHRGHMSVPWLNCVLNASFSVRHFSTVIALLRQLFIMYHQLLIFLWFAKNLAFDFRRYSHFWLKKAASAASPIATHALTSFPAKPTCIYGRPA